MMLFNGVGPVQKFWTVYSKELTGKKHFTLDDIIEGIANPVIDREEDKYAYNCYYLWEDGTYRYYKTRVSDGHWEPEGEYILLGRGRDGLPQFQINGTGNTTFIGSVFTFGFLINPEKGGCITYKKIHWKEFNKYLVKMNTPDIWRPKSEIYVNFIGHEQTAQLLGCEMHRITIRAKPGDKIIWAQYKGPRLEEGSITVPEGAEFTPMKAEIYDNKMKQIVDKIKDLFVR